MQDFLLASLHHLLLVSLVAMLAMQATLVRPGLQGEALLRAAKLDQGYGMTAGLLLAVGFLRVFYGDKGPDFYLSNPMFWTKIGTFALVGLLSVPPTLQLLRWRRQQKADAAFQVPAAEIANTRRFISAELVLLLLIPVFAATMARGLRW